MRSSPPRDAEATKQRLLDAAVAEFAQHGIAGARVDRIAAQAQSNKAQIYHYFGSKDELFHAVFERVVQAVLAEVPLDPHDLPGYAASLSDGYAAHPEIARLATWHQLERAPDDPPIEAIVEANAAKVESIRAAQQAGTLSSRFAPEVLLALVLQIAGVWAHQTPEHQPSTSRLTADERHAVVATAVAALI